MSVAETLARDVLEQRSGCRRAWSGAAGCASVAERSSRGQWRRTGRVMTDMVPHRAGHVPVMVSECLGLLDLRPGEVVVDGTLGLGGHARAMAELVGPGGRLIGVDRDAEMLARAQEGLGGVKVEGVCGNFSELDAHLQGLGISGVDGILLDLGVASPQVDETHRGFSYRGDGPLDMRMGRGEGASAEEWLDGASEDEIGRVIREYGEERYWRRVARAIVSARGRGGIRSTGELAEIVRRAMPGGRRRLHPARRTFQAIRIVVNGEIGHLERFLRKLPGLLHRGGRCVVITYHSLEDRPVKLAFRAGARGGVYDLLTRKPLRAGAEEVRLNPRSRSAKVRAVRRTGEGGQG